MRQLDLDIALETYVKVLGVNVAVLGLVEVLLGDEHTLAEEVLVDRLAVGLGDEHLDGCLDVELGCWTVVRWSMFKKFVPWREFK